jgi:hypothetical protein
MLRLGQLSGPAISGQLVRYSVMTVGRSLALWVATPQLYFEVREAS